MALGQERTTGSKRPLLSKGDAKAVDGQGSKAHYVPDYRFYIVCILACLLNGRTRITLT